MQAVITNDFKPVDELHESSVARQKRDSEKPSANARMFVQENSEVLFGALDA
jgi:hypothetical protein